MEFQTLLYEVADRVATVTINRPEKLNALNAQAKADLARCLAAIKDDEGIDAVLMTGAGDKAFVAGTDIAELRGLDRTTGRDYSEAGQAVFNAIEHLGKPVIAAVNGYALGGGCELALACHIRLASERARFGQPEVNLGIIPGYGGTQRLARLVGIGKAMEMILTGIQVDAQEAMRIGLVSRVCPHDELMARATAMAKVVSSFGQVAIRMALQAVTMTQEMPLSEGQKLEAALFGTCCQTHDFREGTLAFLEKRKPTFANK